MKHNMNRPAGSANHRYAVALEYFDAAYKALRGHRKKNSKLIDGALKGTALTYLEMGQLDQALESARMFLHKVIIGLWFIVVYSKFLF